MAKTKPFTDDEIEALRSLYGRMPLTDIARKLGRSYAGVKKIIKRYDLQPNVCATQGLELKAEPCAGDALSELYFLADLLRRAMSETAGAALARVAREYRLTLLEIEKRENSSSAAINPLDELAAAFASRLSI